MVWLLIVVVVLLLIYIWRLRTDITNKHRIAQSLINSLAAAVLHSTSQKDVVKVVHRWISNLEDLALPGDFDETFGGLCKHYGVLFEKYTRNSDFRTRLTDDSHEQLAGALIQYFYASNELVAQASIDRHISV